MTNEERKMYADASKRAGEMARENRKEEWKDLKDTIFEVYGETLKKQWLEDIEALETHEERIKYVLDRKNLMARAFFPEDYERYINS